MTGEKTLDEVIAGMHEEFSLPPREESTSPGPHERQPGDWA